VVREIEGGEAAVRCAHYERAEGELTDLPAFDRHPVVVEVEDADVARLVGRTVGELGAVAVDDMAVQVERDVVGADHDPVVGAVGEVRDELRVHGDRVAAARPWGERAA
jgi:hypothetical protein